MKGFFDFSYFRRDILGGITAGIVALPLALAFGEQSGLGAAAGLYGAAFIAFFAAMFGGTPTQISGPTAPMTALSMIVVAGLLQVYEGKLEEALPIILAVFLLSGIIQILLGIFKLGSYIRYIPYTVVSGFMTGIGVIILITQIPAALGYYASQDEEVINEMKPYAEELILDRILAEEAKDGILDLEELRQSMEEADKISEEDIRVEAIMLAATDSKGVFGALEYFPRAIRNINFIEFFLCMATIAIIYGFTRLTKAIPSTLVALLVVSVIAVAFNINYVFIKEIPSGYPIFHFEIISGFSLIKLAPYLISALLLALLGAIDSLLTSVVADNLTKTQHDPNKELVGQGIGNGVAALFGGLPGAGATIRTVVNIQAGGKTKISGMVAGLLLFVILILLGPLASQIPAAVLAGILITVGFGVMDYKGLKALPKMEMSEKIILITVLLLTVFWQLVYAVAVGLVFAAVVFLKRMSDISANRVVVSSLIETHSEEPLWDDEAQIEPEASGKVFFKHLDGPMFFGFVTHFRTMIAELPEMNLLVLRMEKVPFIDQSGIYALEAAVEELHNKGVIVAVTGSNKQVIGLMRDLSIVPNLIAERYVFENFAGCRKWLKEILETEEGMKEEFKKYAISKHVH